MTSVFACGYECGVTAAHWTLQSAAATFVTTGQRSGTRALRCNPAAAANGGANTVTTVVPTGGMAVVRVYVWFTSLPTASAEVCVVQKSVNCGAYFKASDSKIYAGSSTASLGATGVLVTTGQWYRLDIRVDTTANPWLTDVSVDGVTCGQKSNALALSTTAANIWTGFIASNTADALFDDLVCTSATADFPVGAGNVYHFVPTSDGTHNVAGAADFKRGAAGTDITNSTTDAYLLVDNIPLDAVGSAPTANDYINAIAPPNATDYTENLFGPAPGISTPTVAPRAVEVMVETAQAATATGSFKLNLNDNGTVDTIKEQVTVAGVVEVKAWQKHYATPPTGGAWTVVAGAGNFNNLRIRFYSADAAPDQYFVAAMIEAEFAPVVASETNSASAVLPQVWNRGFGAGSPSVLYSPCH